MPKLTVDGVGSFDVPEGKRMVLSLEDEAGIDQLHACGGNARCTTCRVEFISGEPQQMTQAEKDVLTARGLISQPNLRLSCQIVCDHDMSVARSAVWRAAADPTRVSAPPTRFSPNPFSGRPSKGLPLDASGGNP